MAIAKTLNGHYWEYDELDLNDDPRDGYYGPYVPCYTARPHEELREAILAAEQEGWP